MSTVLLVSCRRPETRTLYRFFCVMGGFYCSDIVTRAARYVWWTMNVIGFLYGAIIGPSAYLLTAHKIRLSDLLYTTTLAMCHTYATIYTPLVTYYFRDDLKFVLKSIDDQLDCQEPQTRITNIKRKKYDSVSIGHNWLIWMLVLLLIVSLSRPAYFTIASDRSSRGSQGIYIEATPFVEYIYSQKVYLAISIVEVLHVLFSASQPSCTNSFALTTAYEFYNISADLSIQLEHVINDTVLNLKSVGENFRSGREKLEKKTKIESHLFQNFKTDFTIVVKRYQKFSRAIERLRTWIQIMCSVNLLNFFIIQTPFAFIVLDSAFAPLLRIQAAAGFIAMGTATYGSCLLGKIFEDINEMMANELYSGMWYELPSRYQKMIHIFHGQLQQPIQFYAFLVYPVKLATFARALKFVYTILNLLRQSQVLHDV